MTPDEERAKAVQLLRDAAKRGEPAEPFPEGQYVCAHGSAGPGANSRRWKNQVPEVCGLPATVMCSTKEEIWPCCGDSTHQPPRQTGPAQPIREWWNRTADPVALLGLMGESVES